MVRVCPTCGYKNYDDSFWCQNCKNKLIEGSPEKENLKIEEKKDTEFSHRKHIELPYQTKTTNSDASKLMLKKPLIILFACAFIISSYYIVTNLGETNFDWSKYGGCPWDENNLPWTNMDFPWVSDFCIDDVYDSWDASHDFSEVGAINDDYWFQGNNIYTKTGWKFTYATVKDCGFKARVLDYYVYNEDNTVYEAVEIISPLDIFFGYDDLVDNIENYPYKIVSHFYRGIYYEYPVDNDYFRLHQSNTHIIPHNQGVYDKLLQINVGDVVILTGSYVNVYGSNSEENYIYTWLTDDNIGDSDCEIVLVDSIEFV